MHTYRHTDIHTDVQTYRHAHRQTCKHTDIQTYRHTDIQTYRHTDIQTDVTYIHIVVHIHIRSHPTPPRMKLIACGILKHIHSHRCGHTVGKMRARACMCTIYLLIRIHTSQPGRQTDIHKCMCLYICIYIYVYIYIFIYIYIYV